MAILTTNNLLPSPAAVSAATLNVQAGSAFMAAAKLLPLSGSGESMYQVGDVTAGWTAEGENKPLSNPEINQVQILPYKLAVITTLSDEFFQDLSIVASEVRNVTAGSLPRGLDATIAGVQGGPGSGVISSLGSAAPVEVFDHKSFILATSGSNHNKQIVLNRQLLAHLRSLTTPTGTPLLAIDNEYIAGVRYYITEVGTGPLGFVGPFDTQAMTGIVPGSLSVEYSTEGVVVDGTGNVISAFGQNLTFIKAEMRVGFKIVDSALNQFNTLVVPSGS